MSNIVLSADELETITGYEIATKQLNVLRNRGFTRAFINRKGVVVLERTHYEAVTKGEVPQQQLKGPAKVANLGVFRST